MSDWQKYVSHKVVQAARIVGFHLSDTGRKTHALVMPPDGISEPFNPTGQAMLDRADIGDWAIIYADGYRSISPAKAFYEGYALMFIAPEARPPSLRSEIEHAINRMSAENVSNTPDFILAEFLVGCLASFDAATHAREKWYGREQGNRVPVDDLAIEQPANHTDRTDP